ncbi:MAG: IS5 family transposase [Cyanobacteria bacterium J06638_22]
MSKVYPSNLTKDQFERLQPLLPPAKPGGRPREVDLWAILNAIFYVLTTGIQWRAMPGDFPPWSTVYTYFRNWKKDGVWIAIYDELYRQERLVQGRKASPSEAVIDSQSVKSDAMVHEDVGFDAGKQIKGRKRFAVVDTLGLVLRVWVGAASVAERTGAQAVLKRVKAMAKKVSRLHIIWADGGFKGPDFMMWVMDVCRWLVQVVLRPEQTKGFVLLKKRWVVERTFGWLMRCRRLVRDYEKLPDSSETFIYLAMIRILVRRLA